jgi:trimeric autotransporter adhesin
MKRYTSLFVSLFLTLLVFGQAPEKLSFQAVIRDAQGKLISNGNVGLRFTILQGSTTGTAVYSETFAATTNVNGLVTLELGTGITTGSFSSIDWSQGPYYLQRETDPLGGTNYTISGVTQFASVPYALYAEKAHVDGSETKIIGGTNIAVSGTGTTVNPYIISNGGYPANNKVVLTDTQTWSVPENVSKIKVELWGGSGGGGGGGAYGYSTSYTLVNGGDGGSGGFSSQVISVTQSQQFNVIIGNAGNAGTNAHYAGGWIGDTDGTNGGDTYFGAQKAGGGGGGYRGSLSGHSINGTAGTSNVGTVKAYTTPSNEAILNVWTGIDRSYLGERILTSMPGRGGILQGYSAGTSPTHGEAGCAVLTLFE